MAKCEGCGKEMTEAEGCDFSYLDFESEEGLIKRNKAEEPCGDCAARPGGYHHVYCDIERCPVCKGQLLSCECNVEYVRTKSKKN